MKETLQELQQRAADADCYLELEFDAFDGQGNGEGLGFEESGSYTAKFKHLPEVDAPIGWGGNAKRIDVKDMKGLSSKCHPELEDGLNGMKASDYEVIEYDMSEFENVDYKMNPETKTFIEDLDTQLSEAVANMFSDEEIAEMGELKFVEVEENPFDPIAKEIADDVDRMAIKSLIKEYKTIEAFDNSKPGDID